MITHYTATPPNTLFLYPTTRQYLFDEVCEKIVRALEKRNWKVPEIQVKFIENGTGEFKYRYVREIKGKNFNLFFCRTQGCITITSGVNDNAAISQIIIPRRELHVYEDESPSFYTYVGNNWKEDKDVFMNQLKGNSRLNGKPKTYLNYTGARVPLGYFDQSTLYKKIPYLVNNDHQGYEYKACGEEPIKLRTKKVFQKINNWLEVNVLKKIESVEEAAVVELAYEPEIPYPEHVGPFYVKIDWPTYNRILKGKEDKNQLELSERYALIGSGSKIINDDDYISQLVYNEFQYWSLIKPDLKEDASHCAVLRINPKNANNIFVADYESGSRYKTKCFEADPEKFRLSDEEFIEYQRCIGKTIVPIHQYKGNYEKAVVLIGSFRELSFDEVEIVDVKEITEKMKAKQYFS